MRRRDVTIAIVAAGVGIATGMVAMHTLTLSAGSRAAQAEIATASRALSSGELETAMAHAYTAIANDPANYLGYAMLGDIFARSGDQKAASEMFLKALDAIGPSPTTEPAATDQGLLEKKLAALQKASERATGSETTQ